MTTDTKAVQATSKLSTAVAGARSWVLPIAATAFMWLLPAFGIASPDLAFLTTALTYVVVLMGLHVVFGLAGQVTLGPAAVFAIGAYAAGISDVRWHLPISVTILFATALAGVGGILIGLPALRVGGFYLAMVTALAAQAIPVIATIAPGVTGGQDGLIGIIGMGFDRTSLTAISSYRAVLIAVAVAGVLTWNVDRSAWGRAFRAVSVNELAAASMGIPVYRAKIIAFVFSSALGGLAGGMYAHVEQVIDPSTFTFDLSILFFSALIIGGLGRPWGPILGTVIYVVAPYYVLPKSGGNWVQVGFGVALILIIAIIPGGAADGVSGSVRFCTGFAFKLFPGLRSVRWPGRTELERVLADQDVDGVSNPLGFSRADPSSIGSPVLRATDIHVSFGGIQALKGARVEILAGKITALIGPNGSGKTTLLNACCGHAIVRAGRVHLAGQDVTDLPAHQRAALGLSRTFQTPINLASLTTLQNVMSGCQRQRPSFLSAMLATPSSRRKEREALRRTVGVMTGLGIGALVSSDTRASLTDGRLVEVARALALDPIVLLLDEPAAGLDGDGIRALEGVIRQAAQLGVGVLLVDHDVSFVRRVADHVVVLDQGQVIFEGSPSAVGQDESVVTAYLGTAVA